MDDTIFKLTQFGFSTYEAKAYLALLQKNPAIGYEVSKIAKIPTAKIYETNHMYGDPINCKIQSL
ncbi:helix-turn-helix domain-containing protein [Lacrimispora sp.]|uniref:helix-turn-helix domain-containing protein n=1 Tax=Lacrimispora sp. TaxID=2719234 RepID=UPI0028973196|nr:helix-turn-helix domain-containing protein [Lacrimispora sp.]